jgi:hypothetical protein
MRKPPIRNCEPGAFFDVARDVKGIGQNQNRDFKSSMTM